jgi:hypothetical protein
MNRNVTFAYGPSGVAHVVEYEPKAGWNEPDPGSFDPPRLWRSVCGYGVRFTYPDLRLAGHPDGDGAACDEHGRPLTRWCSRCQDIAEGAATSMSDAGLLDGLDWVTDDWVTGP